MNSAPSDVELRRLAQSARKSTTMASNRLLFVQLTMIHCQLDGPEPARQLLDILAAEGCEFFSARSRDPNPERRIRRGSIIAPLTFTHPLLKPSLDSRAARLKLGGGSLGYISRQKKVMVSQSPNRGKDLDELAESLLGFARRLYQPLLPTYAYLDEMGENAPLAGVASPQGVKTLFWANVFGRKLVKQVGETFLLRCPARVDLLDDGGVLLVSRDRFTKWLQRPERASVDYLAQKFPGIQRFRSTGAEC